MKKTTRRIFTLALCLALVLCMALPASASTVTWNDGEYIHTLTVTVTGAAANKTVVYTNASKVWHTYAGGATSLPANSSMYAPAYYVGSPCQYNNYLSQALNAHGASYSLTLNCPVVGSLTVPSTAASGYYSPAQVFTGVAGTWTHTTSTVSTAALYAFSFAPSGSGGVTYVLVGT